ncbi:hypothetical protein HHI36_016891 [Cryptolaemus montrouzieri]|uniref:Saposin B-type domain-containing protein n=1 Tax=Cryptolaemus montrouzieri TaxID=559131 RepID=A0ABD2NKZ5_9CUCU
MKVLVFIVMTMLSVDIGIAEQEPHLAKNDCIQGPSFWCKNLTREDRIDTCIDFGNVVNNMVTTMKNVNSSLYMYNPELLLVLVEKLPAMQKYSWGKFKLSRDVNNIPTSLEDFASWYEQEVNAMATVSNPLQRSAASCHATRHCIQTEWIHKQLPPDNSNICQTCLDMVKQARDQLLSNETQDLIKQVFEGTCNLTHFKIIVDECDKIVDSFIPDLIDTLASEMNPQVVCSVAGLCNNANYLKALEEEKGPLSSTWKPLLPQKKVDSCTGCRTVVTIMENKFDTMSKDDVLQGFLIMCRGAGSLSDACSNVVLTYFTEIYDHLKEHLNPTEVCLLSGECSAMFHTHDAAHTKGIQVTSISNIGVVPVSGSDDLPCELCEQLVEHLRDLLVANTTEEEFKRVLQGLCRQTKSFADECLAIVDEYYAIAYQLLLTELNSTVACSLAGLCPKNSNYKDVPVAPLLPADTVDALQIRPVPKKPLLIRVPLTKTRQSIEIISTPPQPFGKVDEAQLPIDLLASPYDGVTYNKQVCEFCQFFLHYVQQAITNPTTEDDIKKIIKKACNDLPSSINDTCVSFVEAYEPALVALLAQEIDPSQICPLIRACPSEKIHDVDVFMQQETGDNSKCPLCLFAVQKLEEMVKDKKTETDIKEALGKLCSKLPKDLTAECQNFVNTYTDQLVEMLVADLNPQEICVFLKLCTDKKPTLHNVIAPVSKTDIVIGETETNAIVDDTFNGIAVDNGQVNSYEQVGNVECVFCKFMMREIEYFLQNRNNEDEIIDIVQNICKVMPEVISKDCNNFVNQYGNTIIQLLIETLEPSDICPVLQLCKSPQLEIAKVEIFDCPVCEAAVWAMEKILANPKVDHEMKHVLEKTCRALPSRDQAKCRNIIETYGTEIFDLIEHLANKSLICRKIGICGAGTKVQIEN